MKTVLRANRAPYDPLIAFDALPSAYYAFHILIKPLRIPRVKGPEVVRSLVRYGMILHIRKRIEEYWNLVFPIMRGELGEMAAEQVYGQIFFIYNEDVHAVREVRQVQPRI